MLSAGWDETKWNLLMNAGAASLFAECRYIRNLSKEAVKAADTAIDWAANLKNAEKVLGGIETSYGKSSGSLAYQSGNGTRFKYEHNPMDNPKAARDIIENPDAVYRFSPNPESTRIGKYADKIDWTNPEQVAVARQTREAYHGVYGAC